MKKLLSLFVAVSIMVGASIEANASVNTISVTASRSGSTLNTYVKNSDNRKPHQVSLYLQKKSSGSYRTVNSTGLYVGANRQVRKTFSLSRGQYKLVYSSDGKSSYIIINY